MKIILIIALSVIASQAHAGKSPDFLPGRSPQTIQFPTHQISLITKQGYRLDGLLMGTNDSQLIIFPGKYKEWKAKKNYMMVYYPFDKIETVKFTRVRNLFHRVFSRKKKNTVPVNGSMVQFLSLKKSLSKQNAGS